MTPTEIAFLALGLVLGTAVGAGLVQAAARRPVPRREVRLTVTQNSIPSRRAATLAMPNGILMATPLPGSPDARALADGPDAVPHASSAAAIPAPATGGGTTDPGPSTRTRVPSGSVGISATAVAVPVMGQPSQGMSPGVVAPAQEPRGTVALATAPVALATTPLATPAASRVAVLEAPTVDVTIIEVSTPDADAGREDTFARSRPPVHQRRPEIPAALVAVRMAAQQPALVVRPLAISRSGDAGSGSGGAAAPHAASADACAAPRRQVEERCALADMARDQARIAADALREAQRVYDVLRERVDRAQLTADPRHVAAAKERLHAEFRIASDRSSGPDETEAAARVWLHQINELNAAVREAQRVLETGGADLRAQLPVLDRLAAEADAARIAGENAESGCRDAREDLAACEEADRRARLAVPQEPVEGHPFEKVWPSDQEDLPDSGHPGSPAELLAGLPVIVRILRGDREARTRFVAELAAGDPEADRDWQLRLSRLVDAINARAIEDGYLDLPEDDAFWRLFERREVRDIVGALSALGYRFDGMGAFADGRVPSPRDLSLAVGYAGLDRMRIRTWPPDGEISKLYERAVVAADEWLADQAGDLTLGRMVDALGNRAAELADVWNAWGRVRPALLAP